MILRIAIVSATVFANAAVAQDWIAMTGVQIRAALTDHTVIYEAARQDFLASGRTVFNAGADSWGYWVVQGDQYCSQWPPSDRWDCYDMTRHGDLVRFLDSFGNATQGKIARLE